MKIRSTSRGVVAAGVLCAALVFSGCSADPSASSAATDPAVVRAARTAVEAGYAGNDGSPPTNGPAPATGTSVWILSAFEQIPGLAELTSQTKEAVRAIGWRGSVCDGQNNVDGAWAKCVRQAVAADADAIILESIDCAPVRSALKEARAAGIRVASLTSFDCDDPAQGGGDPLFDVTVPLGDDGVGPAEFSRETGALRAQWAIARSGGDADILHVEFRGVAFGDYQAEGFETAIRACAGCDVVQTVTITTADVGQIRQKFETALLQAGNVDLVVVDSEFMMSGGIAAALRAASVQVPVLAGECGIDTIDYIHQGRATACTGMSLGRVAWAAVDGLNRVFAGRPTVPSGTGWYLVDAEHHLPAAGENFDGPVDYRSAYRRTWR
ncbi:substrate-binding domain-containing protein [Streptomyces sp. NPDC090994]|uniref:substrate-binding domain-containing protein n=1 Tax=Streptomyces sp. NPDC090994 TaxID=3365969 RepID=UPI00381040F6